MELRIMAGAGRGAHVNQSLDAVCPEDGEKCLQAAIGMSDGVEVQGASATSSGVALSACGTDGWTRSRRAGR